MLQFLRRFERTGSRSEAGSSPIAASLIAIVSLSLALAGCGGGAPGSPSDNHVQEPVVRSFSPFMSPIDFSQGAGQQNPTYTDAGLTVSADPNYQGKVVIYFNGDTEIDPSSIYLAGNPFLGVDPSVILLTHEIAGVGNAPVPIDARVEGNRIVLQPKPGLDGEYATPDGSGGYITNLPEGQFTVGVFKNLKNSTGNDLRDAPVFHTFFVGPLDTVAPTIVAKFPGAGQTGVGASVPIPQAPPGLAESSYVNISGNIFGDVSPDIVVRMSESIRSSSVNSQTVIVDFSVAGTIITINPATGYPALKSTLQQSTLPSNGHEIVFRPDYTAGTGVFGGGFPFGRQVRVRIIGFFDDIGDANYPDTTMPKNASPVQDLTGNGLLLTEEWTFQTIAPPDLPENPFPEWGVWWSASDRVGVLDSANFADSAIHAVTNAFPSGVPFNVLPLHNDEIATNQNVPNFDPDEINIDRRINGTTCHSFAYVQSANSGQVAILNTRDNMPVALINTPTPGGLAVHNGTFNWLCVTNSSANTITILEIGGIAVGRQQLTGAIYISKVFSTGNTPTAITITQGGRVRRDRGAGISIPNPIIMWTDRTDRTMSTALALSDGPEKTFNLDADTVPNDVSFTPCWSPGPGIPIIQYGAISHAGVGLNGKITFYVAGPNCTTGIESPTRPDDLVGSLSGFDAPDGLDNLWLFSSTPAFFAVAESGSTHNRVTTVYPLSLGAAPTILNHYDGVGNNPSNVAHVPGVPSTIVFPIPPGANPHPSCVYNDVVWFIPGALPGGLAHLDMFVSARGGGVITQGHATTGFSTSYPYSPIPISGQLRYVGTTCSQ